jgi:dipeptidase
VGFVSAQDADDGEVPADGCTSIVVGKLASTDGSVMTTHTCDGWYDARLFVIPGGKHEAAEKVQVWKDRLHADDPNKKLTLMGEIPQVPVTYTYFHIGYPFMNEHGVCIGETTIGGRRELVNADKAWFYIEELEAVALQRGKTAREVVKIMGALAEKYGYADGGECLTVVDGNEGWVFEIMGPGPLWTPNSGKPGATWAAARVPDDKVFVSANRSRIGAIDLTKPDWYMASPGIYDFAKEMGFWDGKKPFQFWEVYGPKYQFYNSRREWRVFGLVAPSKKYDPWARRYPFAVKPDKKLSVQDVMAIKRDHYEGTEFDMTKGPDAGPFGTPVRWATNKPAETSGWERAISKFRCSYSFVSQSRGWLPNPIGTVLWFGEDAPHSTVYLPIYAGVTRLPQSLAIENRFECTRDSAWWAFDFVENWINLSYSYMIEDVKAMQKKLEGEFFAMQKPVEDAALAMYRTNPQLAIDFLTNYSNDVINRTVDAWWKFSDELVAKYNDGYIWNKTKGYPDWWLKSVGFAEATKFSKYKDIYYPDE